MQTAAWVARTEVSSIDSGLDTEKALARAHDFLAELRSGNLKPSEAALEDAALDVLHAAVEIIARAGPEDVDRMLEDASGLYAFVSSAPWTTPDLGEKTELLNACSLWAWRLARKAGKTMLPEEWSQRIAASRTGASELVHEYTAGPISPDEPETILAVCRKLRDQLDASPLRAREEAEFFYRFLAEPKRPIGLFDEREYFLGEIALIAGTAYRILARRDEARRWLDRSEAYFRLTVNAVADWARVSYQRLALLLEERRFEELLEQLPNLMDSFNRLDMTEDALKCRFLEGLSWVETGDLTLAVSSFDKLRWEAGKVRSEKLLAFALVNLVHVHGMLGNTEEALSCSREALPVLAGIGNRIHVGKVHWGIGSLLRAKGQLGGAVEVYRSAQDEFRKLGMVADVASTRLMIADLLLELGQEKAALKEILATLPTIDEYKMVPEGVAALTLLRESARQQKVNHQALRDLHGFFKGSVS
jgi:tetratricopeptide (TPR) repeat protein